MLEGLGHFAKDADERRASHAAFERLLEVRSKTLPEEHADLLSAMTDLTSAKFRLGDYAAARATQESVLQALARTLPDDHPDLQDARQNLSSTLQRLGEGVAARALWERVLEIYLQTLPEEHRDVQLARHNLAATLYVLGEYSASRTLQELALQGYAHILPQDHPDLLLERAALATTLAREAAEPGGASERAADLLVQICAASTASARRIVLASAPREAEERCALHALRLGQALSFAPTRGESEGWSELEAACFAFSETTRGAGLAAATWMRRAADAPEYAKLRAELREASEELARLAQKGTTSEDLRLALQRREDAERALLRSAQGACGDAALAVEAEAAALAERLPSGTVLVAFRRYERSSFEGVPGVVQGAHPSLCAFVVRSLADDSTRADALELVDLGPMAPVEAAVRDWRAAIGTDAGERGMGVSSDPDAGDTERERGVAVSMLLLDPPLGAAEPGSTASLRSRTRDSRRTRSRTCSRKCAETRRTRSCSSGATLRARRWWSSRHARADDRLLPAHLGRGGTHGPGLVGSEAPPARDA